MRLIPDIHGRYTCSDCGAKVEADTTPRCYRPGCTNEAVARLLAEGNRKQYCVKCLYLMTGQALSKCVVKED